MPRRSTPVQRLVKIIERVLTEPAHKVEESVMLKNKLGFDTEVDILITAKVGLRTFLTAIEVRERGRTQGSEWLQQVRGKYADLPQVNRIVVVSIRKFSAQAYAIAKSYGIELRTIAEIEAGTSVALDNKAEPVIQDTQSFRVVGPIMFIPTGETLDARILATDDMHLVFVADGARKTMPETVNMLADDLFIALTGHRSKDLDWSASNRLEKNVTFPLKGATLLRPGLEDLPVESAIVNCEITKEVVEIPLVLNDYGDTAVLIGKRDEPEGTFTFVREPGPGKELHIHLTTAAKKSKRLERAARKPANSKRRPKSQS